MKRRMLAEWEPQRMVQLTWPHKDTDWAPILPEITAVYEEMAREITKREPLLIVAPEGTPNLPSSISHHPSSIIHLPTNDTWARDHGFITVEETITHHPSSISHQPSSISPHPSSLFHLKWWCLFVALCIALYLAIPKQMRQQSLFSKFLSLPILVWKMILNIIKIDHNNKEFIHTTHDK